MLARPGNDTGGVQRARHAVQLLTARNQDHGRDAADPELSGNPLLLLRIDLEQAHGRLELSGRALERRAHDPAWTTPGRPKIDQQGDIAALQLGAELRGADLLGLADEQRGLAAPAFSAGSKAFAGYPVDTRTMRADDVFGFVH